MEIDPGTVRFHAIDALRLDVRRRLLGHVESGFAGGEHRLRGHLGEREPGRFALEVQIRFEVVLLGRVSQELAPEIFGVHAEPRLHHREVIRIFGIGSARGLGQACIEFGWDLGDFRLCRRFELFQMGRISPSA